MNKTEFIAALAEKTGSSKKAATENLNAVLEVITDALTNHEDVAFVGFGTFSTPHKEAKEARNPATGETIQVGAHYGVKFKAGKTLKDAVR